jgi:hypothetical protein
VQQFPQAILRHVRLFPFETEAVTELARISHTFSDSSHALHAYLASQMGEAVLHEHCPRPFERQSRSAERRSVQKKCEKSGLGDALFLLNFDKKRYSRFGSKFYVLNQTDYTFLGRYVA